MGGRTAPRVAPGPAAIRGAGPRIQPRRACSDEVIKVSDQAKPGKRRLKRAVTRIPATFVAGDMTGNGHIKNVSRDGLFLRADTLPAKGDSVSVIFFVPDGSKVEVCGIVRWSTAQLPRSQEAKRGFGILIEQPNDLYLEFYEQLLTQ